MLPELTICTDISFDHVEILGGTLRKIAREKAGIIKPGVPHLIGLLPQQAQQVMQDTCVRVGTRLHQLRAGEFKTYPEKFALDFHSKELTVLRLKPSLIGTHQLTNCALALKAVSLLKATGLPVTKKAVIDGVTYTEWPGRFQIIKRPGRPTVVLDVCHNQGGAKAFVESYKMRFPKHRPPFIVGIVKRKDHQAMFDQFWTIARRYMLVQMKTHRSTDTSELVRQIDFKGLPVWRFGSLKAAYNDLLRVVDPDDIIAVVGSHYLVGEFLKLYG